MAKTQFVDSAGRNAWKDDQGRVYTEGGNNPTNYTVDQWNTRQVDRWGTGGNASASGGLSVGDFGMGSDFGSAVQQAINLQLQSRQPAISSIEKTIGDTQDIYKREAERLEGRRSPLQERYSAIIDSIKGQKAVSEQKQQTATSRELGRRGISTQSGVGEQMIADQLLPVSSAYARDIADAQLSGIEGEWRLDDAIAALAGNRVDDLTTLRGQLAGFQTPDVNTAISTALDLVKQRESDTAASSQRDLIQKIMDAWLNRNNNGVGAEYPYASVGQVPGYSPVYTPSQGEGTYSPDGNYIFRNGKWVKSPDTILGELGFFDLSSLGVK